MKLNLVYAGPEYVLHVRRDMLLFFRHNFEDAGCDVTITYNKLHHERLNIIFGSTELSEDAMDEIRNSGVKYIVFDTEVVTGDSINHRKNFNMSSYLKFLAGGKIVITCMNKGYWKSKGLNCVVMQPGYSERLVEIEHKEEKDIDVFFFGGMSEYRKEILDSLSDAGLVVETQGYGASPYFLRNSYIERAKLVANITQSDRYDHINGIRALYLAINGCCTVSEKKPGITGDYDYIQHTSEDSFVEDCVSLVESGLYRKMGKTFQQTSRKFDTSEGVRKLINQLDERRVFYGPWYKEIVNGN